MPRNVFLEDAPGPGPQSDWVPPETKCLFLVALSSPQVSMKKAVKASCNFSDLLLGTLLRASNDAKHVLTTCAKSCVS